MKQFLYIVLCGAVALWLLIALCAGTIYLFQFDWISAIAVPLWWGFIIAIGVKVIPWILNKAQECE